MCMRSNNLNLSDSNAPSSIQATANEGAQGTQYTTIGSMFRVP